MKHRKFIAAIFAVFIILGFTLTLWAAEEALNKKETPLGSFQIPKNGDYIILPLTLEKQEVLFCFDTGASRSCFDTTLRKTLGKYINTEIVGTLKAETFMETYESPAARLRNIDLQMDGQVMCTDLSDIRKVSGRDIRGILGMDTLKHYIVQIDFDRGELKFFSSKTQPDSEWGKPISIYFRLDCPKDCPAMDVSIDDVPTPFLIDTGSNKIGIDNDLILKLSKKHKLGFTTNAPFITLGGRSNICIYTLKNFSLGPFEHNNLICSQNNRNLLGLSYLSRFQVTFDFPHNTMYLRKGNRYQDIQHEDMSGLHILREDKDTVIRIVDSDSPGDLAGIKAGDRILRIDDQDAAKIEMFDLRNIFKSGNGKRIRLTIVRGEKEDEKLIELKEKVPQWDEPIKE